MITLIVNWVQRFQSELTAKFTIEFFFQRHILFYLHSNSTLIPVTTIGDFFLLIPSSSLACPLRQLTNQKFPSRNHYYLGNEYSTKMIHCSFFMARTIVRWKFMNFWQLMYLLAEWESWRWCDATLLMWFLKKSSNQKDSFLW